MALLCHEVRAGGESRFATRAMGPETMGMAKLLFSSPREYEIGFA